VALEINSQLERLDLNDGHVKLALDKGARSVVSSDAHFLPALDWVRWGIQMARRGWATRQDILNTRSLAELRPLLSAGIEEPPDRAKRRRPGFVALSSLKKKPAAAAADPAAALAELRRIYFKTTKQTIDHDFAHAISLLKAIASEETVRRRRCSWRGSTSCRKEWAPRSRSRRRSRKRSGDPICLRSVIFRVPGSAARRVRCGRSSGA
jgi:hypothetical protein